MRGGGSALPGLVLERMSPGFLTDALGSLPMGTVIVTGTNGKTTTTRMVVRVLRARGLRVVTNASGSNMERGIAAALLDSVDGRGRLPADIAVLEVDEGHVGRLARRVPPRHALVLNLARDQLDRFGELATTAGKLARAVTEVTGSVVLHHGDPLVRDLAAAAADRVTVSWFASGEGVAVLGEEQWDRRDRARPEVAGPRPPTPPGAVVLRGVRRTRTGSEVALSVDGDPLPVVATELIGEHYGLDAAAAVALAHRVLPAVPLADLVAALAGASPAFGRGEVFRVRGRSVRLVLVKNPASFQVSLHVDRGRRRPGDGVALLVNDRYADGQDTSWLWDVDFTSLDPVDVVGGSRAHDMALRLQYDGVPLLATVHDPADAVTRVLDVSPLGAEVTVYATYTAMLAVRRALVGGVAVPTE
jgi:UDP-N-acetylmuramyl tripeptide synthase